MNEVIVQLINILHHYGYVLVFFGAIAAGETVIIAAAFLAFLGFFNIFIVFGLCLLGTVLSDNIWYYIGFRGQNVISKLSKFFGFHKLKLKSIEMGFNHHYGRILMVSKFVYGTRTATLIASGHQRIEYNKFFKYNLISTIIWLILIIIIGYLIGYSWHYLDQYNNYAKYFALGLLILIILIRVIFKRFSKLINYESRD